MKIECAKSTKYLGVRGCGEAAWLFCPDSKALIRRGSRKKYVGAKVLLKDCQKCPFYHGEHITCGTVLVWKQPFGGKEKIGERLSVRLLKEAEERKKEDDGWKSEEFDRMSYKQLKDMSEKHKIEEADNLSLFELKNKLMEAVRLPASSTPKA